MSLILKVQVLFILVYSLSAFSAARSTDITIINNTGGQLTFAEKDLQHGIWSTDPPGSIAARKSAKFGSESSGFMTGTEGAVAYKEGGAIFTIRWDNPYIGSNSYIMFTFDPVHYAVTYTGGGGDNASITVYITDLAGPVNYNIAVASDPQAWRLATGDPNSSSNQPPWEALNSKVVQSMNTLSKSVPIDFSIINGDLTEFGREVTRESFYSVYNKLDFPFLYGLGNHDYENNVGDCTEGLDLSTNACARWSVDTMASELWGYAAKMPSHFSSDYNDDSRTGSLAYSWDYGGIHYVQLQNYPSYTVTLDHWAASTIYIGSSINWLENDLKNAAARGKVSVLNFHDPDDFKSATSAADKAKIRDWIDKYKVIAVFNGHTHRYGVSNENGGDPVFGNAPVFNSGALFLGDFLLLKVENQCFTVSVYNGADGTAKHVQDFNKVCSRN